LLPNSLLFTYCVQRPNGPFIFGNLSGKVKTKEEH
jgi:hypothetical protein